jgi:hypothetical protein
MIDDDESITSALARESVAEAVASIIHALEIVARMLNDPATSDEVMAEEAALWTVKNHAEWICSYIKEKRDGPKIRRVQ